ncbi:AAA family ATPase [Micromonospora sp. NPDC048930]|uniref:ParA family protein n=1 Tax=Micromonospora sp. NPDC048930 TaxID=3364261 RepID=UPI003715F028
MSYPSAVALPATAVLDQPEPDVLRLMVGMIKGGVGKSTTVWMLLCELAKRGHRALGVDADPSSQTLADCYREAIANGYQVPFEVISWPSPVGLVNGVGKAADERRATAVVIDVGGDGDAIFDQAALYADELLIPTGPTPPEMRRLPATFTAAARVHALSPIAPQVLLVRTTSRARDEQLARDWLASVPLPGGASGLPVLDARVPYSVLIPRLFGHVVEDTGPYADVLDEILANRAAEGAAA